MASQQRNLDLTTSSMDKMALNNLIVSMRHLVQRCKVRVINKLVKQIKKYRNRKGPDLKVNKCKRKADRLVIAIQDVKRADKDKTAQFCLSNTATVKEAENWSAEMKAMTRVACDKAMQEFVLKWRTEHEDWQSLAAFLKERVTRRLKKKKKKEEAECLEVKKSQAVTQSDKPEENRESLDSASKSDVQYSPKLDKEKKKASPKSSQVIENEGKNKNEQNEKTSEKKYDDSESKPAPAAMVTTNRNMVVTRLTLTEGDNSSGQVLDSSSSDSAAEEKADVTFLFGENKEAQSQSDSVKMAKSHTKSSFFCTVSGDEDSEGSETAESASSDAESDHEKPMYRAALTESTFVGTLSGTSKGKGKFGGQKQTFKGSPRRDMKHKNTHKKPQHMDRGHSRQGAMDKTSHQDTHLRKKPISKTFTGASDPQRGAQKKPLAASATLHPSWEASKRRKMECSISSFKGKKTTFDD